MTTALVSTPLGIAPTLEKSRVDYPLLALVSVLLHLCAWLWYQQPRERPVPVVPPRVLQLTLIRPAPLPAVQPPRPVIEPPPVVEPPPKPLPKPPPQPKPRPTPPLKPKPVESAVPLVTPPVSPPPTATASAPVATSAAEPAVVPASTRATSRRNPKPDYPTLAKRRGWEGQVLLEVEVLSDGTPGKIQVSRSSGRDVLDNAALKAVKRWLFEPARRGDSSIASTLTLSIVFKLEQ